MGLQDLNIHRVVVSMLAGVCGLALVGCAVQPGKYDPRTTRLTSDDLVFTTNEMAAKLQESPWLRDRIATSEPIVVAITKVENLTSDLIPASEQWWMMTRVRDSADLVRVGREKNIRFVIPKEFLDQARNFGSITNEDVVERVPTHNMSATFRSATRAAQLDRTDAYLCDYRITRLATGELEWTETVAFKRVASGKSYD